MTIKAKSPREQIFGCIFNMVMIWIYYLSAVTMFTHAKAPTEDASTKSLQSRNCLNCAPWTAEVGVMVTEGFISDQLVSIVWLE